MNKRASILALIIVPLSLTVLTSCTSTGASSSSNSASLSPAIIEVEENAVPGTVSEAWAEPMYDTPRIPGKLDPAGNYYRLPHRTIVEIRDRRFQKVEYPEDHKAEEKRNNGN